MIQLKHYLADAGVDPTKSLIMRHRPTATPLREALGWWAAERPQFYNAYQQSQRARQEAMLAKAKYLISCIGSQPGRALFVGVYEVQGLRPISEDEFWAMPENAAMRE